MDHIRTVSADFDAGFNRTLVAGWLGVPVGRTSEAVEALGLDSALLMDGGGASEAQTATWLASGWRRRREATRGVDVTPRRANLAAVLAYAEARAPGPLWLHLGMSAADFRGLRRWASRRDRKLPPALAPRSAWLLAELLGISADLLVDPWARIDAGYGPGVMGYDETMEFLDG